MSQKPSNRRQKLSKLNLGLLIKLKKKFKKSNLNFKFFNGKEQQQNPRDIV